MLILERGGGARPARDPRAASSSSQYERNDVAFARNKFRVRGDTIEMFPAYEERAVRIQLFGDEVERIASVDPLTGEIVEEVERARPVPGIPLRHRRRAHAAPRSRGSRSSSPSGWRGSRSDGKLLEAQRLRMRTTYDLEMIREIGVCSGIENYSRHLDGRSPGQRPFTLLDYFPNDFLCVRRRVARRPFRSCTVSSKATGRARRRWSSTASGSRRRWTTARCASRSSPKGEPGGVPVGDAEPVRDRGVHAGRGADRASTGLIDPEVLVQPDQGQIDDLVARDQHPHRSRPADARHHAHQEDGGRPHRLPHRAGPARALPP